MTLAMIIHLVVPSYSIINLGVLVDQLDNQGVIN